MGTITGISDLDPVRWPNSHWRSVKVRLTSPVSYSFLNTKFYQELVGKAYEEFTGIESTCVSI